MRRFFGQIREYDKMVNYVTGFLGSTYLCGSDQVIRTLMVTLADVPSDFDTMIGKLETRKEAIPWMQEVIDRLKVLLPTRRRINL
jgi:ethanolamine ammonia-lyase large subunit